jgi:hypothetical protein
VTTLLLFLVCWGVYGKDFVDSLLAARVYSVRSAATQTARALIAFLPMLALTAIAATRLWSAGADTPQAGSVRFVLLYVAAALCVGALASGGKGVDVNAFFDLLIASSLGAGLALMVLRSRGIPLLSADAGPGVSAAALGLSAIIVVWGIPRQLRQEVSQVRELEQRELATREDVRTIMELGHGRAACEELSLCYWAGSSFHMDFFNYGQKLKTGMLDSTSCDRLFGTGLFDVVQLNRGIGLGSSRLTPACNEVIRQHFATVRVSANGVILLRKELMARDPTGTGVESGARIRRRPASLA